MATGTRRDPGAAGGCPQLAGYDPLSAGELRDPYPSFARMRLEAPVFYSPESNLWSVSRQVDVLAALKDTDSFSSASALPVMPPPAELHARMPAYPWARTVLTMDDPDHRPARAVVQAPFTGRRVAALEPSIRTRTRELLEPLRRTGRLEFVRGVGYPLSLSVIGTLLGIPQERFALLERAVDRAFQLLGYGLDDPDEILAAATAIAELRDYMYELVADRRANPRDDYTSVMAAAVRPDGTLESDDALVTHVWVMIGAGFETTANMLALGLRTLVEHPDQWRLLRRQPELVDSAVEEVLRYRTLIKRIFRTTTREVELGGVTIPAGARVALLAASANRDPDGYDDDPDMFDITRRSEHLAFGRWKHFCVGAPLARLEMRVVLQELIENFGELELAPDQSYTWRRDLRMDVISSLDVRWPPALVR